MPFKSKKDKQEYELKFRPKYVKRKPYIRKFSMMKSDAIKVGHKWNIPKDIGYCLITSPCAYCGSILEELNGLDRIDSNKEYTLDNVVPCCKWCNYAKNSMTVEEFKNHINKIYKYLIKE